MASEEARATWLHYANHCIVEEDYKGASGPGSLPPSSSKSGSEGSLGDGGKSYDFAPQQPKDNATSFWEPSWEIEDFAKLKELEAVIGDSSQKKPMVGEVWSEDDHLLISRKPEKLFSEMESQLTRISKTELWWRTADLASFVSDDKSLQHFDNSDVGRPQKSQCFVPDKGLASLDEVSNYMPRSPNSIGIGQSQCPSGCLPCGLDIPLSELSKGQLLEALCHSQTRAREAEEAAQKAYCEKEHLITHFLRQASQLFAYKHILQLETSRNSKYQPSVFPWIPIKGKKQKRVGAKTPRYKLGKSFGSIVLGLSLAGAGLLLGWTLGWLFR